MTSNKEPYTSLPAPLPDIMGRRAAIAAAIETLIDVIDLIDGEPDGEDNGDDEPTGDEEDAAWIEWNQMRGSQKRGATILPTYNEDDEDDDPREDDGFDCEHDGSEPDDGI